MKPFCLITLIFACGCVPAFADMQGNFSGGGDRNAWKAAGDLVNEAEAVGKKGDYRSAVSLIERAITLYSTDPLFYYELGLNYQRAGETSKAEPALRKSVSMEQSFENVMELAVVLAVQKNWKEAELYFQRAAPLAGTARQKSLLSRNLDWFAKQRK